MRWLASNATIQLSRFTDKDNLKIAGHLTYSVILIGASITSWLMRDSNRKILLGLKAGGVLLGGIQDVACSSPPSRPRIIERVCGTDPCRSLVTRWTI